MKRCRPALGRDVGFAAVLRGRVYAIAHEGFSELNRMTGDQLPDRRIGWIALAAMLLVSTACGDGRIKTYPVTGKVLVDGQPIGGLRVVLYPIEGSEEFEQQRPIAYTEADGTFQMMTFKPGDGAPAGDYRVGIKWPGGGQKSRSNAHDEGRPTRPRGPDAFQGRFKPENSGLTAEVPSGGTECIFEVSTK